MDMGGGGVQEEWMSTFKDLPKYKGDQNLLHLKHQSESAFKQSQKCEYGKTANVFKFSSLIEIKNM